MTLSFKSPKDVPELNAAMGRKAMSKFKTVKVRLEKEKEFVRIAPTVEPSRLFME